ncbi:LacI family DNA-binding transcriptional regulator [Kitasatospora sp. CM 4170]|uniref:LacI family DNA-binding transcriptional regulator n=1 Tax=Kitasatospora aburaviensis TaxID=67265 RepID=A0ABW1EQK3_9ACTN|nr:LacI family DNA-binding transcriptional regulator [Kitasatospora sp. CM 4170]WNM44733.1 LacI family DNA-binding transcriptional regulator [Kitasatospora sp. CM 4170]
MPQGAPRPRRAAATIEEVARAAGVSRQTVSNALNAPQRVRPDTLTRVRAAIERLGYRPDQSARSLRTGARRTLGYLAPVDDPYDPNPLMAGFLEALVDAAAAAGYRLLLFRPAPGTTDARPAIDELIAARQVDGLVLADVLRDDPRVGHVARTGVPFAAFGRTGPGEPQHWVDIDNGAATAGVVRHLADRGHRRVAFAGPAGEELPWMAARRAGFAAEAARLGLTAELPGGAPGAAGPGGPAGTAAGRSPAGASAGPGVPQLRALLQGPDRPTAVAAGSDLAALAVYEAVRAEGLVVGRDVAVVGFHDTPLCRHLHPALSSVRLPLRAIAAGLVGLLLTQIRGETVRGEGLVLQTELVVRASSG